ncbi:MAG: SsrA-binding protein [Bacteroidetes bacterium CG23_combo_of_CG06-09_8_20_14_all_32_9]|nr:MAG: SsrA-binding protein [Bacteroidetes bacterium CG23_combo_of_CG06-09_8_20_14_all_32_9]
MSNKIISKNKKAGFHYELFEKFVTGIILTGSEIKSIRQGKINFVDSYCIFINNELFIRSLHIAEYTHGGYANHVPVHDRKLLLKRSELNRIQRKVKEKGFTIIPISCFITEKGLAKLEIAISRGKKLYDKRETIKKKDRKRETDRAEKN